MLTGFLGLVLGYLLGSIPFAYIISKLSKGIDIRDVDNGNMGGASTLRAVGIWQGALVIVLDIAKGYLAVLIASALGLHQYWVFAAGFAAVLGHNFPLYIGFRGGQGVCTIIGIFLFLAPWATLGTLIIIGIVLLAQWRDLLKRIFFSILVSCPTLPVFIWLFYHSWDLVFYALIVIVFLVVRNIAKIKNRQALMNSQQVAQVTLPPNKS